MKLLVNKQDLARAVEICNRVTPKKTTIPVLEKVVIAPNADELLVIGGDTDLQVSVSLPYTTDCYSADYFGVDGKAVKDLLKKMQSATDVTITVGTENSCTFSCGHGLFTFTTTDVEAYPELPAMCNSYEHCVSMNAKVLKSMIDKTIYAAASDKVRPVFTGALFEPVGNYTRAVCCAGCRLALRDEEFAWHGQNIVIPAKALKEISRLLSKYSGEVDIYQLHGEYASVCIGEVNVITRLLQGTFFDYRQAIPKNFTTTITANTKGLMDCLGEVSMAIGSKEKCPVTCTIESNEIKMTVHGALGTASSRVACEVQGDDLEIGFNPRYLMDALKNSDCDSVRLQFGGRLAPCIITPVDNESSMHLVLPVNLRTGG